MNPVLKWAGSKRWLELPPSTGTWIEPFAGSAAQFFKRRPAHAILCDSNKHLINFYQQVKEDYSWVTQFQPASVPDAHQYRQLRDLHNSSNLGNAPAAAVFLTLNRTCFNGLWRESKSGGFNVPWCKDPDRVVRIDLKEAAHALQGAELMCGDFELACERAMRDDTVYMDPPYYGTWDEYQAGGFSPTDHARLFVCAESLRARGVKVIISYNEDATLRHLYRNWKIENLSAPRGVAGGRSRAPEILITG